jgi:hypothetical protein
MVVSCSVGIHAAERKFKALFETAVGYELGDYVGLLMKKS